ncbi:MAG: OmpA family protein [Nitrospinae bacterium]|nr:OmpA family protein [Nitrospinota bacterium]
MHREMFLKRSLWVFVIACTVSLACVGVLLNGEGAEPAAKPMVEETEWEGVKVELTSVERAPGNTLTIKFKYTNEGSKEVNISHLGQFGSDNVVNHVYYVDNKNKKKYLVVKDAQGKTLGTNLAFFKLDPNQSKSAWARFPEPPADVQKLSWFFPGAPPFEDVPILAFQSIDLGRAQALDLKFHIDDLRFRTEDIKGAAQALEARAEEIKGAVQALAMKETTTEVKIELAGDILFDFDKADIRPEAEPALRQVVEVIKQYPKGNVAIDGYTDAKGADPHNLRLSDKRAASVKSWLAQKGGVDGKRIKTKGWGKAKPVAPNTHPDGSDNPEGRQKNRRVEITVKK